jgi:hypothetical protein
LKRSIVAVGIITRKHHTEATNQLGYYLAGLIEGDGSIIFLPRKLAGEEEKGIEKKYLLNSFLLFIVKKYLCIINYSKYLKQELLTEKNLEYVDIVLLTPMRLLGLLIW